jgi:hypothetical protein
MGVCANEPAAKVKKKRLKKSFLNVSIGNLAVV